jgi:hypothetical protein
MVNVHPVLGCWHCVDVGYVVDVLEERTASIIRSEVRSVCK